MAKRWDDLHARAGELAELAAISHKPFNSDLPRFAEDLATASDRQRRLAGQAIEDIGAIMKPGLTALRTIAVRDQDTTAPAIALWREFQSARESVLAIVGDQPARVAADAA